MVRRQLRGVAAVHPDEAEGIALFLGAVASGDPGYLASSEPGGDPTGELDLSRPLGVGLLPPRSSPVLSGVGRRERGFDRRLPRGARRRTGARCGAADPAAVLSLVAAQLDGAERDQACAVFRAVCTRPASPLALS